MLTVGDLVERRIGRREAGHRAGADVVEATVDAHRAHRRPARRAPVERVHEGVVLQRVARANSTVG